MEDATTRSQSSSSTSEAISGLDDTEQDSVLGPVPSRSPAEQMNVGESGPSPRLASLTELLLMNQKTASRSGNSASSDSSPSIGCCFSSATLSSTDQTPSPAVRTSSLGPTTDAFPSPSGGGVFVETDLRRLVFHHSRAKRLVSGLRVHAFTRQAFVSSFTVGLTLGSVIAILLKILRDLTQRMLYG